MDVEKPQRAPLSVFRHCETLARQGLAVASPGAPLGPFFLVCNFFKKKISKNFRFSTTVNEYLTLGSLFAIFEPCFNFRFLLLVAHIFFTVFFQQFMSTVFDLNGPSIRISKFVSKTEKNGVFLQKNCYIFPKLRSSNLKFIKSP